LSKTVASLRRKIVGAGDLQSVVRTMKAVAASSIGQYENSVRALADYYRTVELGLGVCFRHSGPATSLPQSNQESEGSPIVAVVFGSDQGLVGRFNDVVADHAIKTLKKLPGEPQFWAVGERVQARLQDAGHPLFGLFPVPNSVKAITPLIGRILLESETRQGQSDATKLYLFYNRPTSGSVYAPVSQRLLPLDATWHRKLAERPWPTKTLPEVIDEELFDVISGFEALVGPRQ
jgi:F-type H+-transporting ATPase subunit gamma